MSEHGPVTIAGAGIAGLTAALAFAGKGSSVRIFERAERLEETGAGLQLSPNATRLLGRLGVLEFLRPNATQPEAVLLRDARSLRELARVPLGKGGEERWGAPYLVMHRADLQKALLAKASSASAIELIMGTNAPTAPERAGSLLVGADGVRSTVRHHAGLGKNRFTGQIAWRATIPYGADVVALVPASFVTAFLHRGVHLVAYPVSGGTAVNLVAVTTGNRADETPRAPFEQAMRDAAPQLRELAEGAGPWTPWPIHVADSDRPWTSAKGIALIGDAAHAMTPYAAQGAAMAIEDAVVLADCVAVASALPEALSRYEALRRPRVARVARRGRLNKLAWHARGPMALIRNLVLKLRGPQRLAADLDWLYGWDVEDGGR